MTKHCRSPDWHTALRSKKGARQGTLLSVLCQPGWEGSLGKNGYVDRYGWVPLLSTWNSHSIVHQLYSNIKLKVLKIQKKINKWEQAPGWGNRDGGVRKQAPKKRLSTPPGGLFTGAQPRQLFAYGCALGNTLGVLWIHGNLEYGWPWWVRTTNSIDLLMDPRHCTVHSVCNNSPELHVTVLQMRKPRQRAVK